MTPVAGNTDDELVASVAAEYGASGTVDAVVHGGSAVMGVNDAGSDLDLYVYSREPLSLAVRTAVAARFSDHPEVGNAFWESGDEWTDRASGRQIDVIFRSQAWIEGELDRVLVRHEASIGYSTSLWHNVLHSTALFDPAGWFGALQGSSRQPYPEPLRRAIVAKNHPILRSTLSSYLVQVTKAMQRDDTVSVQHRVTALLASYFDILFAINEMPHPGEKRQLTFAMTKCSRTPRNLEADTRALLSLPASGPEQAIIQAINELLDGLDELLRMEALIL